MIARGALLSMMLLGLTYASESKAMACSCDEKQDLAEALEKSSLVFVGQVKGKSINPLRKEQSEVRFTVNRKLKGFEEVPSNTVLVYTPVDFEYCGYKFQEGLDYLVFATGTPAHFQTTTCTRTEVLDKVLTDVHKLIRMTGATE
ncbi:MAG: hypothetical protein U0136_02450 [Bdellovibrionota bacterium]